MAHPVASPSPYNPEARAPRFEQFLSENYPLRERRPDRFCASLPWLRGHWLHTRAVPTVPLGIGANGKSCSAEVIRAVLGITPTYCRLRVCSYGAAGDSNDLAALEGRRFVTVRKWSKASDFTRRGLSHWPGGDRIPPLLDTRMVSGSNPRREVHLSCESQAYLVADDFEGFWRRVRLVPSFRRFDGLDRNSRLRDDS